MNNKKNILVAITGLILAGILLASCNLVDPTQVKNPLITDESLVGQVGSMQATLQGVRSLFSSTVANTAYFTDCVSDNYDNVSTFISPNVDLPTAIRSDDLTLNGNSLYPLAQRVRALATFAIDQVAPKDASVNVPTMVAETLFLRGMATLILGENFSFVPVAEGVNSISANALIDLAITDLKAAMAMTAATTNIKTAAQFALARAYRQRGNKAEAVTAANAALALNPTYVYSIGFDATTNTNTAWNFLVSRNLNDMQPLPRLDFLDPKYTDVTGISPIPVLKAEEMYLILAEAALSDNNLAGTKAQMKSAIALAKGAAGGRTTISFLDRDPRSNRPNADNVTVKADGASPEKAGLVKRRSSTTISVNNISNTSTAAADVDALASAQDHLWMIHLLRQEIFFLEGRRMCDLGIRLPMMQREIEVNPVINPNDPGTVPVVPAYVPTGDNMDKYTVSGTVVTILVDMNRVLATNKVSPFTMPF